VPNPRDKRVGALTGSRGALPFTGSAVFTGGGAGGLTIRISNEPICNPAPVLDAASGRYAEVSGARQVEDGRAGSRASVACAPTG